MTLMKLYRELSKIIDDNISLNPSILDSNVVFNAMPYSQSGEDLIRSGFYPTASVSIEDGLIIISNTTNYRFAH